MAAMSMAGQDGAMARLHRQGQDFCTGWGRRVARGRGGHAEQHTAGGHPKITHPSPQVPPLLSPSQFPGPPYTADGCWVRGVSAGAVLAMQHLRAGLYRRLPSPGWAFPAGLGARVETDGSEPPRATPAPRPGSRALRRGTRTSPSWPRQREGVPSRSPTAGHGEASSSLCRFPLFLPPFGFWQWSRRSGSGARCRGRAAKRRQPPAAPRPPVPRLVAGRRAACAWWGSVSCGRIPAPCSLPISLRAGTAGGSGGTGGESWGGRIVKGKEGRKKKKKKMDTCHRWSGEAAAAKTPAGSGGAKTHRRRRGGSGSPSRRGVHGGRAARQRHGAAEAGRVADGGAGEERGICLRFKGCVCVHVSAAGAAHPGRLNPVQAARGLPGRPAALLPAACPAALPALRCPQPLPGTGRRGLRVPAGARLVAAKWDLLSPGRASRGRRGRLWLCLVGLCLPAAAAAVLGAARGGGQGRPRQSGEAVSQSPAGTWEPSPKPGPKVGLPQS